MAPALALGACTQPPQKLILGKWTIMSHVEPTVSAMSPDVADGWRGSHAILTAERATMLNNVCDTPGYFSWTVDRRRFEIDYRIPPAQLGITDDEVRIVRIDCKGSWRVPGSEIIVVSANRFVIPWNGVFFLFQRDASWP